VLKECDDRIRIPMQGRIQSLNVSAAAAVTLFEVVRQRRKGIVPAAKPTEF
jgi:23S rRNA (guanosine2251-2'-O)-methyltransferase